MTSRIILIAAAVTAAMVWVQPAAAQGGSATGQWVKRTPVKPDPSKVVVPPGYKVGVFKAGLDTPASATVDKDGNLWVTISGVLLGSPEADQFEPPHVKIFDKDWQAAARGRQGTFKTVMNEIGYCAENGKTYIPEYGEKIWEMDGVNGELEADHQGSADRRPSQRRDHLQGRLSSILRSGFPSNSGFADPDNHGWTDIPNDPFWVKHQDGHGTTPHDPVCRDIVHTGLNVKSSDGRMTGALLPVGVPAKPGMIIKAQVPCGGSIMRVKMTDQGADGIYPHEKMEVYAMGFRNQAGVAFGPAGTKWANALAVTDNGANDLGHRRIANAPEKLFIVTEKGQDAGFPDKEGIGFVTGKRYALAGLPRQSGRPAAAAALHRRQAVRPEDSALQFQLHVDGARGVPLIAANPNPNGYINPVLEWDTNNPIDGIAWSARNFGADNNLFGAVFGILDTGPESLVPTWPLVLRDRIPRTDRGQMVGLRAEHRAGAECLPEAGEPRRARAAEQGGVQQ